ncbi:MAG: NUDIX domain-containing protein [candidate division NC10 bacterium]|nr:NUDIX domain-containing protein [candidate division NC10 bacterium]MBI2113468.1 NUDIX domain-containing protein [candidate division NC10 bacterium]MBI2163108.1 NUDIX domain-containing protein [candidate division NC10 bacterium]MBI2454891.1 NUDIX domain-containing protein [candidate division NC10 bacterium]MBI3121067.1 NUDIX domain-containing protein [candidate division NC10 bacterium]
MKPETDITKATELRPGVAAIISNGEGKILLQRRSDNGLWGLPGGSVEIGESVRDAIVREVREETGLTVEVVRLIGVYSDPKVQVVRYPDGNVVHYISSVFACRILAGTLQTCDETLDLQFFDPARLPEDLVPMHRIRIRDWLTNSSSAFIR